MDAFKIDLTKLLIRECQENNQLKQNVETEHIVFILCLMFNEVIGPCKYSHRPTSGAKKKLLPKLSYVRNQFRNSSLMCRQL